MKLLDKIADKLGYEPKRERIPGQFVYTSKSGTWLLDVEQDV